MSNVMSKYVLVDELYRMIENEFDGVCVYDVASFEAIRDFQNIVDKCTHYEFPKPTDDSKVSPCIRNKCLHPQSCCGCDEYYKWKKEKSE